MNKRSITLSAIIALAALSRLLPHPPNVTPDFAVWGSDGLYPKTWSGLITCYIAATPFFRNSLIGDFAFAVVLFGGFAALERSFVWLREQEAPLLA